MKWSIIGTGKKKRADGPVIFVHTNIHSSLHSGRATWSPAEPLDKGEFAAGKFYKINHTFTNSSGEKFESEMTGVLSCVAWAMCQNFAPISAEASKATRTSKSSFSILPSDDKVDGDDEETIPIATTTTTTTKLDLFHYPFIPGLFQVPQWLTGIVLPDEDEEKKSYEIVASPDSCGQN